MKSHVLFNPTIAATLLMQSIAGLFTILSAINTNSAFQPCSARDTCKERHCRSGFDVGQKTSIWQIIPVEDTQRNHGHAAVGPHQQVVLAKICWWQFCTAVWDPWHSVKHRCTVANQSEMTKGCEKVTRTDLTNTEASTECNLHGENRQTRPTWYERVCLCVLSKRGISHNAISKLSNSLSTGRHFSRATFFKNWMVIWFL